MPKAPKEFPFPFFGAGNSVPFESASLLVYFVDVPDGAVAQAIADDRPPPFASAVWDGKTLVLATDFVHRDVVAAYGGKLDADGFAPAVSFRKLEAAVEAWLLSVHARTPIHFVLRPVDTESDPPKLSAWHRWSVRRAPEILSAAFADVLEGAAKDEVVEVARQLVEMAGWSRVKLSAPWVAWAAPARRVFTLLADGDVEGARAVIARYSGHSMLAFHLTMLASCLSRDQTGEYARAQLAKWPQDLPFDDDALVRWAAIRQPLRRGLVTLAVDVAVQVASIGVSYSHFWQGLFPALVDMAHEEALLDLFDAPDFRAAVASWTDRSRARELEHHMAAVSARASRR